MQSSLLAGRGLRLHLHMPQIWHEVGSIPLHKEKYCDDNGAGWDRCQPYEHAASQPLGKMPAQDEKERRMQHEHKETCWPAWSQEFGQPGQVPLNQDSALSYHEVSEHPA